MRKAFLLALLAPVALLASSTFAQSQAVLDLKARIPLANVNGRMDHMAVDLTGQRLFAAAFDNHTLEVIDLPAGRPARTHTNHTQPQAA
jgi:hypothetical protein